MLEKIGYDPEMARCAEAADATIGRVVRVDRGVAGVLTEHGLVRAGYGGALLAKIAAEPEAVPCTGDWCVLRAWPDRRSTLESVLPRRTALVRATAGEQSHGQVLCTNIEYAAVVVSLHPEPVLSRVERLLTLAWDSGAQPLVVLTKADLVRDADHVAEDVAAAAPGVEVVCTSTVTGAGLARIRELVDGRNTVALLGSSGHGKSTLTNALVGTEVLSTKDIREDGRGRHTSVRRELVLLPGGGAVIDTPGLRGIGMVDAEEGLAQTFADVDALVARCRFADCSHAGEPGCAVADAVATGALPHRRFESWQKLQREMEWMASRKDARLRAERRTKWKQATRESGRSRP
ncbi:MAG TPA: ribosome small subunit-dependent GTPase A [Nocardioidaceae bacterium]|nr:ribosome small subunit-dependent GTPase A [Nocardioidaceae bacterium]